MNIVVAVDLSPFCRFRDMYADHGMVVNLGLMSVDDDC